MQFAAVLWVPPQGTAPCRGVLTLMTLIREVGASVFASPETPKTRCYRHARQSWEGSAVKTFIQFFYPIVVVGLWILYLLTIGKQVNDIHEVALDKIASKRPRWLFVPVSLVLFVFFFFMPLLALALLGTLIGVTPSEVLGVLRRNPDGE